MAIKDWYKLTFPIESDSEEIIIWKLNELGIFSFSFEYLIKNENKKEVNIWLPVDDGGESSRCDFEKIISKLLNICLLYTSPSPRDRLKSRMPSSA